MIIFDSFDLFLATKAIAWRQKSVILLLSRQKSRILYLLSAQLLFLHIREPESGGNVGNVARQSCIYYNGLNCALKKWFLRFLVMFQVIFKTNGATDRPPFNSTVFLFVFMCIVNVSRVLYFLRLKSPIITAVLTHHTSGDQVGLLQGELRQQRYWNQIDASHPNPHKQRPWTQPWFLHYSIQYSATAYYLNMNYTVRDCPLAHFPCGCALMIMRCTVRICAPIFVSKIYIKELVSSSEGLNLSDEQVLKTKSLMMNVGMGVHDRLLAITALSGGYIVWTL